MINVLFGAAGLYAALVGGLYMYQRHLLYHPFGSVATPVESGIPEMRPITVTTEDDLSLTSWYAVAREGRPTIVYFHGNAGNISHRGPKIRPYLDAGFGVLLVGYRGYGENPGSPTEDGLYADGRAALEYLAIKGIPAGRIVLYGESLGTGVAIHLAAERAAKPVGAIVLESAFTSIAEVAQSHYPFIPAGHLVKDRFDSEAKIAAVRAPLFFIHGEQDRVVPFRYGQRLFAAAPEPKERHWIAGADHNDLHRFGVNRRVIAFLDGLFR